MQSLIGFIVLVTYVGTVISENDTNWQTDMFSFSLNENATEPVVIEIPKDSGAMIILTLHAKKYHNEFTLSFNDFHGKPVTEIYYEDHAPHLLYNGQTILKPTNLFHPERLNFIIFRTRMNIVDFIVNEKPVLSLAVHAVGATVMIDGLDIKNFVLIPGLADTKDKLYAVGKESVREV